MAPKRSLALAVEAGKVEFWTTSAERRLHALPVRRERHDYFYIHLNNDLTTKNDNRGKCVAGHRVREGPEERREGRRRPAGRLRRRLGRRERDPRRTCTSSCTRAAAARSIPIRGSSAATHLLFSAPRGTPFTLALRGTVAAVTGDAIQIRLLDGQRLADAAAPVEHHAGACSCSSRTTRPCSESRKPGGPRHADGAGDGEGRPAGRALDRSRADDAEGPARRRRSSLSACLRLARRPQMLAPAFSGPKHGVALLGEGRQALLRVLAGEEARRTPSLSRSQVLAVVALERAVRCAPSPRRARPGSSRRAGAATSRAFSSSRIVHTR